MPTHRLLLFPVLFLAAGIPAGWFWWPEASRLAENRAVPEGTSQREKETLPPPPARPLAPELAARWDFIQRLRTAAPDEFPGLWEELMGRDKARTDVEQYTVEKSLLAARWAEIAPEAAAEFFWKTAKDHQLFREVFRIWSQMNPQAALAAVTGEKDKGFQKAAVSGIVSGTAGDPALLIAWGRRFRALGGGNVEEKEFDAAVSPDWLRKAYAHDPAACRDLANELPPWFSRRLSAFDTREALAANVPAALARIDAACLNRNSATGFLMAMMPAADITPDKLEAVMEHLTARLGTGWFKVDGSNYPDDEVRPWLIAAAKAAPDKVRALLASASGAGTNTTMTMAFAAEELFGSDPRAALQLAPSVGSITSIYRMDAEVPLDPAVVGTPAEALTLLQHAPGSHLRDSLLHQALSKMAPEAAAEWLNSLPPGELKNVAQVMMANKENPGDFFDLEIARAGAGIGADAGLMDRIRILTGWAAESDPESVAVHIAAWPDGPARDAGLEKALQRWVDTPSALAWAEQIPSASRAAALSGILETWAVNDPVSASKYAASLPEDVPRDGPVSAFARGISTVDPAGSLQWAATVMDPALRSRTLENIAGVWIQKDPAAAREGFERASGLTPAERQLIEQLTSQ